MAMSLDRVAAYDPPPDVKIGTVETDEALAEWVSVYCTCFGVPDTAVDDTLRAETERTDAGPVVRFAATLEGGWSAPRCYSPHTTWPASTW